MNKFNAKVTIENEENAKHLILAFFREFNSKSSIFLKGNSAKLEIVFNEKPPMEIINAISSGKDIELFYGGDQKNLFENEDQEHTEQVNTEVENSENAKQVNTEVENLEHAKQVNDKKEINEVNLNSKNATLTKGVKVNISELDKIAEKAVSFEDFAKLVAEWLEMNKRGEYFENLELASTEVNKICWKELEVVLSRKAVVYSQWDKIWTSKQVSTKLSENSITILQLLKEVSKYKEYTFEHSRFPEHVVQKEKKQDVVNETENFNEINVIKMNCMPDIKEFEEILATIDKMLSVEQKVRYVLAAMGLNEKSVEEQEILVKIVSIAVEMENINLQRVFENAGIPDNDMLNVRMKLSEFINDFVKKYDKNRKIYVLTFLTDLQKIII